MLFSQPRLCFLLGESSPNAARKLIGLFENRINGLTGTFDEQRGAGVAAKDRRGRMLALLS